MFVLLLFALMLSTSGAAPWSGAVLQFVPLIEVAPDEPQEVTTVTPACTTPAPIIRSRFIHCYRPSDIYAAYGVKTLHDAGTTGKGQTIVIVDSYGSPTALHDLKVFSSTFGLPEPDLTIIFPQGTPQSTTAVAGQQVGWAFETSLDLQWAHAIAPDAKLVLVATVPAETEGVQGFPNMLKGEEIAAMQFPGSVMSQSFAATEQSFHDAGPEQVARFDEVYQLAKANHVTVFGSSGDSGTANVSKADRFMRLFPFPTVNWPSSDPLVTSAGGTWLQFGWRWNPIGTAGEYHACVAAGTPVNTCRATYLKFTTPSGRTEAVWKEDWLPAATGGGRSVLFTTPSFQNGISSTILNGSRGIPDLSWNAAVDGGVLVFTSFPDFRAGWHTVGGTSASSPQLAAVVALANQMRHSMGKGPVGYLNPKLYGLPPGDFNDIVPLTFGSAPGQTLDSNAQ
ncbi:MAG TPA: S53 family peptidase, partial [bacterium]|nr:S53 family peptidase [bacterium]